LRFCENDSNSSFESLIVNRFESFGKKGDSCQVESPKIVTRVESLTCVEFALQPQHETGTM